MGRNGEFKVQPRPPQTSLPTGENGDDTQWDFTYIALVRKKDILGIGAYLLLFER